MRKPVRTVIVACALASVLSACATSTTVSAINADRRGHLMSEFTPETINSGVVGEIRKNGAGPQNFREMEIRVRADHEQGSQVTHPLISTTYINAGHGMVQQLSVLSTNEIPFRLLYALTYRGILPLKTQGVTLKASQTLVPAVTKKITRLPEGLAAARENTEYKFEYAVGREIQLADFWNFGITCQSTRRYAASSLHRNLSGDALDLVCEYSKDGVLDRKVNYVFLQQYGFAVLLGDKSAAYKLNGAIADVEIR
jgi:hypothetical protein